MKTQPRKVRRATLNAPPRPPRPSPPLLAPEKMEKILGAAMSRGADFAEVYVERATSTAVSLEEQKIKSAQTGLTQGIGVRVISGGKVGYAYSDDLEDDALFRAAKTAYWYLRGAT